MNVEAIKEKLINYSKEELSDLIIELIRTYIVEGTQQFNPDIAIINIPKYLRELSFNELILELQKNLALPELSLFKVRGKDVYVMIGGREFLVSPNAVAPPFRGEEVSSPKSEQSSSQKPESTPKEQEKSVKKIIEEESSTQRKPSKIADQEATDRFKMLDLDD